jgi:inhibitor of KinA sporulation pathway (predicted exonuclease)
MQPSNTSAPLADYYLVIDFEATCCDRGSVPHEQMEIIEIGAVMVEAQQLQVLSEFQSFVRPVRHPELTSFCMQLTSITQQQVDVAPAFGEVMTTFEQWLYRFGSCVFCSWGDYDRNQLQQDCTFHDLPYPIDAPHLNLTRQMTQRQHFTKKLGLGAAVRLAGLEFTGTHHRGIDDARNIARLLPYIVGDGELPGGRAAMRRAPP